MPTVVIGNNTGDNYSGTEDAFITDNNVGGNNGGDARLYIYRESVYCNTLIKFSGLSNIPGTATDSSLNIYYSAGNINSITISAHRILRNWGEGAGNGATALAGECSATHYASPDRWTTAGALGDGSDVSDTLSASITGGTNGAYRYYAISGTQLITDVNNMIFESNYGWRLRRTDGTSGEYWTRFVSSEGTDGRRPYLSVTYTESGGSSLGSILGSSIFNGGLIQ